MDDNDEAVEFDDDYEGDDTDDTDDEKAPSRAEIARERMLKLTSAIEKRQLLSKKIPLEQRLSALQQHTAASNQGILSTGRTSTRNKELSFIPASVCCIVLHAHHLVLIAAPDNSNNHQRA
jgi:hypothetical protein